MSKPVKDMIGRPINEGDIVLVKGTSETGLVMGRTAGRRTMVDVRLPDYRVVAFYGTSLYLR